MIKMKELKNKIKPVGNRVLLYLPKNENPKSDGGILLPATPQYKIKGRAFIQELGKEVTMKIKKGDRVIYDEYAGLQLNQKIDGIEEIFLLVTEDDIIAIEE